MDQEQLDAIEKRIKASSANVVTVRHLQSEKEAQVGAKQAVAARKRNTGIKRPHMAERLVLKGCSEILDRHPKVAQWWRVNTGAMKMDNGRYVKFSFVGASDLMFFTTSGRFGACECKATGKKPSDDQVAFLSNVALAGGFAVCVDHPAELAEALKAL